MQFLSNFSQLEKRRLRASDIVSIKGFTHVRVLHEVENVGDIEDMLRSCPHNAFPVVGGQGQSNFCGLILRSQLCVLLKHPEVFTPEVPRPWRALWSKSSTQWWSKNGTQLAAS